MTIARELDGIVAWYLRTAYGRTEGPGVVPFYADPARVGHFAVDVPALAAGDPEALFRLLVTLSSYQSRRDVDIMAIQRDTAAPYARAMTSHARLRVLTESSRCAQLRDAYTFDRGCDVRRDFARAITTCDTRPRTACHVKDATTAIRRMGDLGKLPTSAYLHLGAGGLETWVREVCAIEPDPHARAALLVDKLSTIYKIGRKLASMFVTAVSVPDLGNPTPWFPAIDGSRIVVVDANVGRAIQMWRRDRGPKTYEAMSAWFVAAARKHVPARSPRFVQQAVYVFRSRSNRVAQADPCASGACDRCPSRACPFR